MEAFSVRLKPVYSCPAEAIPSQIKLPSEIPNLSWHQIRTWELLNDPEIDIVFNTAMTGDGKSLAAYLKAMTGKNYTLAMYPTNELARDQERQVQNYKALFNPDYDPQIYRLTGATLADFVETRKLSSKQQGIIDRVDNSEILLTNPDIFHYIHSFCYLRRNPKNPHKGDNADKLFRKIDDLYKLFIFDEFHIFSSPQIASVMNTILLMKHTSPGKKFLFLSATPNEALQDFLRQAHLRFEVISPVDEDKYRFSLTPETSTWRPISQPITLTFPNELEPNVKASYEWLVENAENTILQFFLDHPGSKGAIILNSIASVYKLSRLLKPLFEQHNLKVLVNTSLTGETERSQSITEADLLIGTSTIDVGVDFKINFLVFEASDAGNFIQRFGRLGRHPDFLPRPYQAYALIPNFLVSRLFGEAGKLREGEDCDRVSFNDAIRESWSFVNQFEGYPSRWGSFQSWKVWNELCSTHMKTTYPNAAEGFRTDAEQMFRFEMSQRRGQVYHCMKQKQHKIIDEALSFRGSSQLDCAVYDTTNPNEPERERFKTYNLPGLLSNFVFELMEKDEFLERVRSARLPLNRFQDALCYLRLMDYREVRENWYFYYAQDDFSRVKQLGRVQILKQLEIEGTDIPTKLRRALSHRGMVCYVSDRDRTTLRTKLGLPMQFQAYGLSDRTNDRSPAYTIAFGQSALMLETPTRHWKPKEDIPWIC
ncbi:type I-D CRISPR-associated helicase Cas3' [Phormidesmis sp. 146-35]